MDTIDYLVIAAYMFLVLVLGPLYRNMSGTASDYFRGGGGMLWWMVGASSFMITFSAWSFTGAAGRAYEAGTFVLLLFLSNGVALIFTALFTASKYRQMRIITPVEAIRKRYGRFNEQFFTWIPIPLYILMGGIGLYAIGIFMSIVFGVSLATVVLSLGGVVTVMSMFGGASAVVASDFIQLMVIVVISIVMMALTLMHPDIGGANGLIEKLPAAHLDWSELVRPKIIVIFAVTLLLSQLIQMNSLWEGASRYLYVKNGRDARKAAIVAMGGFFVFSIIWLIPAMAATILHPNLAEMYPQLSNPNEAAYVATALSVLPKGMVGLLVCAIFAATMSSMDSGLNRSSGVIVRNFYLQLINPNASEKKQVVLGKVMTVVLGIVMTLTGLLFAKFRSMPLFDMLLLLSALVGLPTAVPLFFGIFVKRVPSWAAWSTVLIGILVGGTLNFVITKSMVQQLAGGDELNTVEFNSLMIGLTTGINFTVCLAWFLLTMMFWRTTKQEYRDQVDAFFTEMHTPIDMVSENIPGWESDRRHYTVLGVMCMAYGSFISFIAILPNPVAGRMAFVFCGGVLLVTGVLLYLKSKSKPIVTSPGLNQHG